MPKLSDQQLVLLSAAAQRNDRMIALPPDAVAGTVVKLFKPLLKQGLAEEMPARNGHAVFRRDRNGDAFALRITQAGLAAIGIDPAETEEAHETTPERAGNQSISSFQEAAAKKPRGKSRKAARPKSRAPAPSTSSASKKGGAHAANKNRPARDGKPKAGSKQAILIGLLQRKQGADIDAIVKATDWLPHTGRAVISGLRKAGYKIDVQRKEGGKAVYCIVGTPKRSSR